MKKYKLVEIFDSIQGEGLLTGVPMTFVRFSGCNLKCNWCDTPYGSTKFSMSETELVNDLVSREPKWVLFTGGEPTLQLTESLCQKLKSYNIKLTWESNGVKYSPWVKYMDHVTFSPKQTMDGVHIIPYEEQLDKRYHLNNIDELRYIIDETAQTTALEFPLFDGVIFVSPLMDDLDPHPETWKSGDGHSSDTLINENSLQCCLNIINNYKSIRDIRLSIQTHKVLNLR